MANGTKNHVTVGKRVQVPAYSDAWMRGARFGTVERFIAGSGRYLAARDPRGADIFVVRMDAPAYKRPLCFIADDCQYA